MALIPLTYKISFYDPSKPGGVITVQEDNANLATSLATQFSMQDIVDTAGGGGVVVGTGTPNAIPIWDTASEIGDSAAFQFDGGPGLKEFILDDGFRFVVNRDPATTVGDPEFAVAQAGVTKTSFGWDDDGGGYGFLYNWEGNGFKFGSTTLYPQLELMTSPDIKVVSFSDFEFDADIIDVGGNVGNAGDVLTSNGVGAGVTWGTAGGSFLPLAGGTMTGVAGVDVPDNFKWNFGNAQELEIYNDNFNTSYIVHNSGLDFRITTTGGGYIKLMNNLSSMINCAPGDHVALFYNGVKKFETTVTGTKTQGQMDIAALNTAPANAADTGTLGEIRYTADYIYVCVATDTWKRSSIVTW